MENVKMTAQGTKLVIEIDATQDLGRSKSGKTNMVATTSGNYKTVVAGREIFVGLNVFAK